MLMEPATQKWYAVGITAAPEAAEAVEYALNSLDALGTEINNLGPNRPEILTVVGYFNDAPSESAISEAIAESLSIYEHSLDSASYAGTREVENEDWLSEWKKHWKPTESGRFVIAPTWEKVGKSEKIVIRIEPSMAFGTGTHETTRLCLKAIEENYRAGESFFDVGTGTGILAIAVAKLNGRSVSILACDTDADSIAIARENAELNATPAIEYYVGSITSGSPEFDVVCANVTLDVIVPLLPLLIERSRRLLILSGILAEQEPAIRETLIGFGVHYPAVERMGEWISVIADLRSRIAD